VFTKYELKDAESGVVVSCEDGFPFPGVGVTFGVSPGVRVGIGVNPAVAEGSAGVTPIIAPPQLNVRKRIIKLPNINFGECIRLLSFRLY
jgi:hypothetical protein